MITDFLNYWFYEPWRMAFIRYQIGFLDKTIQISEKQKQIATELIACDTANKENLKLELMQMVMGRGG